MILGGGERAILAACLLPGHGANPHDPLDELRSLAATAGAVPAAEVIQNRQEADPGTLIGSGKVAELAEWVRETHADVVLFDNDLTPRQLANVEQRIGCKTLDRSELILDIFAARARTHEAKLQVELAQLEYTYPRLRAMWTHLERITGGAPTGIGTRGPGEQQIEIDRRIVQRRKSELKRELKRVEGRKEREVAARNRGFFTVGLVGYTNAGKSTFFNAVTPGGAHVDDRLFATLSTRTRRWDLGDGDEVLLSDTVGFVRDLPHHLVASFRATLEEAVHADLLLLLVDVSHPRASERLSTVERVLDEIGAATQPRIVVFNKSDRVEAYTELLVLQRQRPSAIAVSGLTGAGIPDVVEAVRGALRGGEHELTVSLPLESAKAIDFLEHRAVVHSRHYEDGTARFEARIGARQLDQLKAIEPTVQVEGGRGELAR